MRQFELGRTSAEAERMFESAPSYWRGGKPIGKAHGELAFPGNGVRTCLYEQVEQAAKTGTVVNQLYPIAGVSRAGYYRFSGADDHVGRHIRTCAVRSKRLCWIRSDNLLCLRHRRFILTTDSQCGLPIYPDVARTMVLTA
jgi:hypothetical protein